MTDSLVAKIKQWKYDPYQFVIDVLGAMPYDPDAVDISEDGNEKVVKRVTKQQCEALNWLGLLVLAKKKKELGQTLTEQEKAVVGKFGISIRSGKGTGKTAFLAWANIWILVCWTPVKVVCTAGKKDQIKDVLWTEIVKWIERSDKKMPGLLKNYLTVHGDKIYVNCGQNAGKTRYSVARTASRSASSEDQALTLQGHHEQHMMLVADEASGVPEPVFQALDQTMSDVVNFMLVTFNPNRNSGFAYDTHNKDRKLWICLHWNAEECENVSKESIYRLAKKYGVDSNAYRIAVRGEFPLGETDCVIPLEWVLNCVDKEFVLSDDDLRFDAMDPAGEGKDECVIMGRVGPVTTIDDVYVVNETNTMEIAYRFAGWVVDHDSHSYGIDVGGLGVGIKHRLKELPRANSPRSFNFNGSASNKEKYHRWGDEAWFKVRDKIQNGEVSLPDDDELIMELSSRKYKEINGKIKVETKKDLKKRGLTSPNKADAFIMLHAGFKDRMYSRPEQEKQQHAEIWKEYNEAIGFMGV